MKVIVLMLLAIYKVLAIDPINPAPAEKIPENCKAKCASTYGLEIGIFGGVRAYSNCCEFCANFDDSGIQWPKNLTGFARDVYVGIRWQCVEYARRYLVINKNVSFESIDNAYQIFNLTTVNDLTTTDGTKPFLSFENGNVNPPEVGDLIIYPQLKSVPTGHVAVVSKVDLKQGYVAIAEQNYYNKVWESQTLYSRRVKLIKCDGKYVLTEIPFGIVNFKTIFSFQKCCHDDIHNVVGWKRVQN
jgi:glutathionylspermidine amidase/synthetase